MKKMLVDRAMAAIEKGQQGDCLGFIPSQLAMAFVSRYSLALEEALLKLLKHPAGLPIRIPAYCALHRRYKKISPSAREKLEKFKKNKRNKGLVTLAKKQYGI